MRNYKLIHEGRVLFSTTDKTVYEQVREEVSAYYDRYGSNGVEDFIEMLKEEL